MVLAIYKCFAIYLSAILHIHSNLLSVSNEVFESMGASYGLRGCYLRFVSANFFVASANKLLTLAIA